MNRVRTSLVALSLATTFLACSAGDVSDGGDEAASASVEGELSATISADKKTVEIQSRGEPATTLRAESIKIDPTGFLKGNTFESVAINQQTKVIALSTMYFPLTTAVALFDGNDLTKASTFLTFDGPGTESRGFNGTVNKLMYLPNGNLEVRMQTPMAEKDVFVYDATRKPLTCTLEEKPTGIARGPRDCPVGTFTIGEAITSKHEGSGQFFTVTTPRGSKKYSVTDIKAVLPVIDPLTRRVVVDGAGKPVEKEFTGESFIGSDLGAVHARTKRVVLGVRLQSGYDLQYLAFRLDASDLTNPLVPLRFDSDNASFIEGIASVDFLNNGTTQVEALGTYNDGRLLYDYDAAGKPLACTKEKYGSPVTPNPGECPKGT